VLNDVTAQLGLRAAGAVIKGISGVPLVPIPMGRAAASLQDGEMTLGTESSPTVLIVDDHSDTAEMYALALSRAGYETVEARSPDDALAWLLNQTRPRRW